jgi:NADH-quinone oxidoreductase subunit G
LASSWAPQWNSNQSISKFQDEVAGDLKQGNPGVQIISKAEESGDYYPTNSSGTDLPQAIYRAIPAFQIFGSDELSNKAAPIRERLIGSYAAVSPADATQLQLKQNDLIELKVDGAVGEFSVCIREKVKPGTVVVFNGEGGYLNLQNNAEVELSKSTNPGTGRFDNLIVSDLYEEGY